MMKVSTSILVFTAAGAATAWIAACTGTAATSNGAGGPNPVPTPTPLASSSPAPTTDPRIHVAAGFASETIATVPSARELVGLPNGDLLVATGGNEIFIVPHAEGRGAAGPAHVFITLSDNPAQGVALTEALMPRTANTE